MTEQEAFEARFPFYSFERFPNGNYRILQTQDAYEAFQAGRTYEAKHTTKLVEALFIISSGLIEGHDARRIADSALSEYERK